MQSNKQPNFLITSGAPVHGRLLEFISLDSYLASGGSVSRDLEGNAVYCEDEKLVRELVLNALNKKAEIIKAQGWGWVHFEIDFPYQLAIEMRKIEALSSPNTYDFDREITVLENKISSFEADIQTIGEDEAHKRVERFTELVAEQNNLFSRREEYIVEHAKWDVKEKALAGCILSLSPCDGALEIRAGFIKKQDFIQLEKLNRLASEG